MTRVEMWDEFENQLKREIHTPITMSYDDIIRLAELGIEETVARWKQRLEQETCGDCISREKTLEKFYDYIKSDASMNDFTALYDIVAKMPSVQPKTDILDKARAEIARKAKSGQWSDATMYGMLKAVAIIDKYRR